MEPLDSEKNCCVPNKALDSLRDISVLTKEPSPVHQLLGQKGEHQTVDSQENRKFVFVF